MKKLYFVFCKDELLLERHPDGTRSVPLGEEPPVEMKPWTKLMNIDPMEDGTEVKAYAIDAPVVDHPRYEMCGLIPTTASTRQHKRHRRCRVDP